MALTTKEKHKLKRFIRALEQIRGRHTELVTVYIPAGYDLNNIIGHLQQEQGTAENIKDKTTRTHVIDSLERMIRHLRLYKRTPEHGLAVFSGNASDREGKTDIQVWCIEPPEPIKTRMYRCDQTFVLDILKEMMEYKEVYGLIVLDRREASIGLLKGTAITELQDMHSAVPGKTKAGGQCVDPETIVSMADGQFLAIEEVTEGDEVLSYDFKAKEFKPSQVTKVWTTEKNKVYRITVDEVLKCSSDHLIFLNDGSTKPAEKMRVGDPLIDEDGKVKHVKKVEVVDKMMMMFDMEVQAGNFLAEGIVVHNSAQRFARIREEAAKEFFNRVAEAAKEHFLHLTNLKGILVGGPGPSKLDYLNGGFMTDQLMRKVITTQDLGYTGDFGLRELVEKSKEVLAKEVITEEKDIMNKFFKLLATNQKMVAYGMAEVKRAIGLSAVEKLLISENIDDKTSEELEMQADSIGAQVIFISTDTNEGQQLADLGGVAAFLRYSLS